jgi:Carbohydrate-selective porin, OprB family
MITVTRREFVQTPWFTFDGEPSPRPPAASRIDADASAILAELGHAPADVQRLVSSGAVGRTEWANPNARCDDIMLHPTDTHGHRSQRLITFALCLLLGSMVAAENARAQARQTTYPVANGVNDDPDQGEPQANPQPPPPPPPRPQLLHPPPPRPQPPQPLFPDIQPPWATQLEDLRRRLYAEYGITFAAAYNQLYQYTSATAPTALYNQALGAWAQASMTWTPLDRGGDHEGTLVVRGAYRGSLGDNAVPAQFGVRDIGSIWSNYEFTSWKQGFRIEDLFWEQQLGPEFSFRVGNQGPQSVFNFFRFKDARTGFTASPLAFNETIPYPTFGLGGSFRWQPVPSDPEVYVVGTLNDMNGDPADLGLDWNTFGLGQYFYGLEIGKNWRRDNGEFDHFHIDVFYASERSTRSPDTSPNTAGGGFKVAGEKQVDRVVGFASYTYNTAEGGGISATLSGQTAVAGLAYLRPFGVQGEAAVGFMWSQLIPGLLPTVVRRSQSGVETYWNIGVTPNSTFGPGVQFIFNPVLNPNVNVAVVPSIKFRATF